MSFFGWGKSEPPKRPAKPTRSVANRTKAKPNPPKNEMSEEEIFQSVDKKFFKNSPDGDYDPFEEVLSSLFDDVTALDLEKMIATREAQLEVINARLYANVISNYDKFVQGMVHIRELGVDLETTVNLCRNGRSMLRKTDKELISAPVNIIANNRKSILFKGIIDYLQNIKSIQNTEVELKVCLSEGDFPSAIQHCKQFAKDVKAHQQFTSVQGLRKDIEKYEDLVQQKLDDSLLEVTRNFSEVNYERLLKAYKMSGKLHRVTKKLQQNFTESVSGGTQDLLYAHVVASERNAGEAEKLRKSPYGVLTTKLAEENFMPCLQRTFEYLVELMHSHYQMREWHLKVESMLSDEENETYMETEGYKDIREGLERFSKVIWDHMQRNVVLLLKFPLLPSFKIEPFISVLDAVSKLIEFGEEFSGSPGTQLQESILQVSRDYFQQYNKKKLEDLRTMVENEHWEAMPVQAGFSPVDIKEIRHFVQQTDTNNEKNTALHSSSLLQRNISHQGDVSALASLHSVGNPFSEKQSNRRGDIDSDDEDEELKQEYVAEEGVVNEEQKQIQQNEMEIGTGASVTIVCVNLVRYIGNYLQMMKVLQPIANEVFRGITQLYQYYLYTVFYFFSSKPVTASTGSHAGISLGGSNSSFNYHTLFQRGGDSSDVPAQLSFIDGISNTTLRSSFGKIHRAFFKNEKHALPRISNELDIQSSNSMYGLKHRTVALESLEFLAHCMNSVKAQILQLLPRNCSELCLSFYEQYVDIVPKVRDVIMEAISERFVNVKDLAQQIEKLKWNVKDIDMQHNPYINGLIEEFRMLSVKLQQVVLQGIVSRPEKEFLLKKCILLAMEQLVEGYSRVKKCSVQGRTQMSLDLQVFVTALMDIAPNIRPIPGQNHVDMYIKAFYSENVLGWIKEHQNEYTGKQLLGLAVTTSNLNNQKDSKELFKAVDEICAQKKN